MTNLTDPPIPPITGTVTVALPVDEAFALFTSAIDRWWPRAFHIGAAEVDEIVLEPFVDGRWYERGVDGSGCDWGRVRLWDARSAWCSPGRSTGRSSSTPTPEHASEIDVRFRAEGPAETTVEVEHSGFEKVVGGQTVHDTINGGGGWTLLLDTFAKTVA